MAGGESVPAWDDPVSIYGDPASGNLHANRTFLSMPVCLRIADAADDLIGGLDPYVGQIPLPPWRWARPIARIAVVST